MPDADQPRRGRRGAPAALLAIARAVGLALVPLARRRRSAAPSGRARLVVDALQVPREFSGVATQVTALAAELASQPRDFELVLRAPGDVLGRLAAAFPPDTTLEAPIPSSRPVIRRLAWQQLLAPLHDRRETVVLAVADQAPLLSRAPVVLIAHDVRRLVQPDPATPADTAFYRLLQPPSLARADVVLTVSAFSASEIGRVAAPRAAPVVVHDHPRPRVEEEDATEPEGPLLVVGALRPYKAVEDVVAALALLGGGPELVVVGGGDPSGVRSAAVRQGVADRVRVEGWLDRAALEALLRSARAVVAPSAYEGYGLPVAEGLAWGRPVVASAIPPHLEVLGGAGLTYPQGDVAALAACLRQLDDPATRRQQRRLSRQRSAALAVEGPSWAEAVLAARSRLTLRS